MAYPGENEIVTALKSRKESTIEQLSKECNLNIDTVRRAVESLKDKGVVTVTKENAVCEESSEELKSYCSRKEFPEYSVYKKSRGGIAVSALVGAEKSVGLQWALKKRWITIDSGKLKPLEREEVVERANTLLVGSPVGSLPLEIKKELLGRGLLVKKLGAIIRLSLTEKGRSYKTEESIFSVAAETKYAEIGKTHPLSRAIARIKGIFTEMGFEEMDGEYVESTFWNFDALFQPQDHPARELADTFYVDKSFPLPSASLVKKVRLSHEKGWKYEWKESEATKGVLRTHTTALSARALASMKEPYKKYFAVGRVFRNEETDFKHLAEFHHVEGIVAWNDATFRDLLGILKEFFRKLGFEKIRFRPSYFPYTEPSLEVEVYYEQRKEWMELGGAGIFRPSVTKPLTNIYPVLAWGLSLERPLMLSLGLNDIRTFYKNDLDWLKSSKVSE